RSRLRRRRGPPRSDESDGRSWGDHRRRIAAWKWAEWPNLVGRTAYSLGPVAPLLLVNPRPRARLVLNNVSLGAYAHLVHSRERHRRRREALAAVRALGLDLRRTRLRDARRRIAGRRARPARGAQPLPARATADDEVGTGGGAVHGRGATRQGAASRRGRRGGGAREPAPADDRATCPAGTRP